MNVYKFGLFRNGLRCELDCSHVLMSNRKPLIEKLEQHSPLSFRVEFRQAIVIACRPADFL